MRTGQFRRVGNHVFPLSLKISVLESESLLPLSKNEQCKWFARDSLFCSQKTSDSLDKIRIFHHVFDSFPPFYAQKRIASIALCCVTLYKRVTVSESNSSLLTKERPWAICSFPRVNCLFALSLTKNERFALKTEERSPNPIVSSHRIQWFVVWHHAARHDSPWMTATWPRDLLPTWPSLADRHMTPWPLADLAQLGWPRHDPVTSCRPILSFSSNNAWLGLPPSLLYLTLFPCIFSFFPPISVYIFEYLHPWNF